MAMIAFVLVSLAALLVTAGVGAAWFRLRRRGHPGVRRSLAGIAAIAVLALTAVACGSGDTAEAEAPAPTATAATQATATPTPEPASDAPSEHPAAPETPGEALPSEGVVSGSTTGTKSTLISPAPNSVLTGASVFFAANRGSGADLYALRVGSEPGEGDFFEEEATFTRVLVTGLPTDGRTLYVRVSTRFGPDDWGHIDYSFVAATE